MTVNIYTYTNSAPKKKITGFAFVIEYQGHTITRKGAYEGASKNIAEVYTVLNALHMVKKPCEIKIFTTDFVKSAIETWIPKWRESGWKNSKGMPMQMEFISLENLLKPHKYSVSSAHNSYTDWLKRQAAEMEK